jgi:hypothetical protein
LEERLAEAQVDVGDEEAVQAVVEQTLLSIALQQAM